MRHGLCVANIGAYADPRTVVELGGQAEAAGWEALLVWDHLGFVWGSPAADPWVTLAAVAARTTSLLLGTNVTPVARRRPHVLAHQVATLDVLSGGRVVFGAGIGGITSEFTAFGEDADARTRADQLDEGLEVLRRLWSGDRVDHHGRHYTVDGVTLAPRPAQEQVPIWIGGNSARALRRAARFDGWAADTTNQEGMTKTPGDVERALVTVREARRGSRRIRRCRDGTRGPGRSGRLRRGGRDLVAGERPRQARERRGDARAGAAGTARLADEHAENRAEERMPPRRLGERTPVAREGRQAGLPARGVVAVHQHAQRPERRVLDERHADAERDRPGARSPTHEVEGEAECGAVECVHRQTDRPPVPPRDGLAE